MARLGQIKRGDNVRHREEEATWLFSAGSLFDSDLAILERQGDDGHVRAVLVRLEDLEIVVKPPERVVTRWLVFTKDGVFVSAHDDFDVAADHASQHLGGARIYSMAIQRWVDLQGRPIS